MRTRRRSRDRARRGMRPHARIIHSFVDDLFNRLREWRNLSAQRGRSRRVAAK